LTWINHFRRDEQGVLPRGSPTNVKLAEVAERFQAACVARQEIAQGRGTHRAHPIGRTFQGIIVKDDRPSCGIRECFATCCPCSSVSASLLCRSTNFFTATIFRRPPKSKKVGQLPFLRQFQFFDPTRNRSIGLLLRRACL